MLVPGLYIKSSPKGGRGVFTASLLVAGSAIELAPVIVLPVADRECIHQTFLHDYYFNWGTDGRLAIALGYGSIYNHDTDPNADFYMDFEGMTINFFARREIAAGEEITIKYAERGELWFKEK